METVAQFLKDNQIFYLATLDENQPRVRPFGAVCVFNEKLYFGTNNQKSVSKQIKQNSKIEISAATPDGSTWLRLTAEAVAHDCREARQAMLEATPSIKGMYHADDGIFEVFYLQNAVGNLCSRSGQVETHTFS